MEASLFCLLKSTQISFWQLRNWAVRFWLRHYNANFVPFWSWRCNIGNQHPSVIDFFLKALKMDESVYLLPQAPKKNQRLKKCKFYVPSCTFVIAFIVNPNVLSKIVRLKSECCLTFEGSTNLDLGTIDLSALGRDSIELSVSEPL